MRSPRSFVARFAVLALVPASLFAANGGVISDGGAEFTRTSFGATPQVAFFLGTNEGKNVLFQMGWWVRVAGETAEAPFGEPDSVSYLGDQSIIRWNRVAGSGPTDWLAAEEKITVIETSTVDRESAYLLVQLQLENLIDSSYTVQLFHYADADVDVGDSADDVAAYREKSPNEMIRISDGSDFVDYVAGVEGLIDPDDVRFRVTDWPTLRNALNDTSVTTLDGSGLPFGPADFTGGYQFTLQMAPFGTANVVVLVGGNQSLACSLLNGLFCDGFETGNSSLWVVPSPEP